MKKLLNQQNKILIIYSHSTHIDYFFSYFVAWIVMYSYHATGYWLEDFPGQLQYQQRNYSFMEFSRSSHFLMVC